MAKTLDHLITDSGERSTYDAASQCSRCGYCEQACPTYVITGQESKSPRGRNQLLRMMLEKKLEDPASAAEAWDSCLLCGACSSACYAHIKTADLVLEGRRAIRGDAHWLAKSLTWLLEERPQWLARLLKLGYALKRLGLSRLAGATGILRLLGLRGLAEADAHVDEVPDFLLFERLREDPSIARTQGAKWLYFAACGTNYLFPRVGLATIEILKENLGAGAFADNPCCGLLAYNYGDLEAAKRFARKNIERFERSGAQGPLVGDCSSCVAYLKSYAQLFLDDPAWKERAERFVAAVKDVIELPAPASRHSGGATETIAYHDSCRARHGEGLIEQGRCWARSAAGDVKELPEAGWCCGGAGAYAFTQPELSDELIKRKAGNLAAVQATTVVTSSTSCLLQLAHGLKKYYPDCRVLHVSELVAEASRDKKKHR